MKKPMIKTVNSKTGFLRAAFVAGIGCASLFSASLYAQAPATEATAERIVVTGSNIPTAEEVLASPLDTVTTQDIQIAGGTSDILSILQKRNPDFSGGGNLGGSNANIASGATQGGSIISLRGLPTLVLFEGRRIVDSAAISAGGFQFSDVSIFPTSLISRIEVLKDGASALYGSEAVGGVVNIFLKKDFNGVQIDGRYGFTPSSAVSEAG
ncbi:MAG: TonB-dependent receptor plug domain-containing protein [Chthoniobacterales bacterium]